MPVIPVSQKIFPVLSTLSNVGTPAAIANDASFILIPAIVGQVFTIRKFYIHAANAGLFEMRTATGVSLMLFYLPNHQSMDIDMTVGGLRYPGGTDLLIFNRSGAANDYQFTVFYEALVLA
jgi:hypothetical protein